MIRWLYPWIALAVADPAVPPPPPPATTIPLRPATPPRPALKYQLVPERYGLVPGNAAVFYDRAILLLGQPEGVEAQAIRLLNTPLDALSRDEVRGLLDRFVSVIREVEFGADRRKCDWGFDDRPEGVALLLPEIQRTRSLCRLIDLKTRLAIAEGRLDDAWKSIRTGMTLARHVGDGPVLVQGIIGVAIGIEMTRCVEHLIAAPGSPSLFWALADRPRPLVDLRAAFEGERHILERDFPVLLDLDRGIWTAEQARAAVDQLQGKLLDLYGGEEMPGLGGPIPAGMSPSARALVVATLCAKAEPGARRALIAGGRPIAEVEALPVVQVALQGVVRTLRDRRDEAFKWANIRGADPGRAEPPPLSAAEKRANPLLAIFALAEGGLDGARRASLRVERRLDALQVVEAIRLDATQHQGHLPASLDALGRGLPIPPDPATGRPFGYRVEGDSVVVSAPNMGDDPADPALAIEIRLVPAPR